MGLRTNNIKRMQQGTHDVLVLGAGINGAVSAAALAARGAKVALIDKGDFSGFTSQSSSNLAWGGIKYMETYEFGLVRKLCMSRNHLIRNYPSTVEEIRFYTNLDQGFRFPPILIYAGALFYWLIGNFFTKPPRLLSPERINDEEPVINTLKSIGGMEYSDAYLHDNDARFVFNFIRSAMNYGCSAANYVEALSSKRDNGIWVTEVRDRESGETFEVRSRSLINACGPYVDRFNAISEVRTEHRHVYSKGIHLIVPRLTKSKRVLTFFADDGRLFFAIPMGNRTVIGTTDTRTENPKEGITEEDRSFVLDNINKRLNLTQPLTREDIIAERWGVRPLVVESSSDGSSADWVKLSRKHEIDVKPQERHISIFGGKLTDCLNVGEEVCDFVQEIGIPLLYPKRKWYGEPERSVREEFLHQAKLMGLDQLPGPEDAEPVSQRLWRRYGSDAFTMLEEIREDPSMGEVLIEHSEYRRVEIAHAAKREMITHLEDFLRRRSKISLVVPFEQLRASKGLKEACRLLFGEQCDQRWEEYFRENPVISKPQPAETEAVSEAA